MNEPQQLRLRIMGVFSVAIMLAAAILPPIPQPQEYHQFADQRIFFGIPNFLNVVSNLPFLVIGIAGLTFLLQWSELLARGTFEKLSECGPYMILFLSVLMAGFCSAYYHLWPDNELLLWDRLPIAVGITALLAATLVERVSLKVGLQLLPFLIMIGIASVLYWYCSEQLGAGNLNFYIVTQFYALLLVILLGVLFSSRYTRSTDVYVVIALYSVAKLVEIMDQEIYDFGHIISGHTLKHLIAAVAVYWILRMLQRRCLLPVK
ncbi:MAG: alkaline phytoceramidase [Nitrosomonas sp.]|nr:alkaline phytoceramidase [Nitrosomonas sp.]MDP1951118.1 alkaline phytoceramidase [Nitrosomonas sp.]